MSSGSRERKKQMVISGRDRWIQVYTKRMNNKSEREHTEEKKKKGKNKRKKTKRRRILLSVVLMNFSPQLPDTDKHGWSAESSLDGRGSKETLPHFLCSK